MTSLLWTLHNKTTKYSSINDNTIRGRSINECITDALFWKLLLKRRTYRQYYNFNLLCKLSLKITTRNTKWTENVLHESIINIEIKLLWKMSPKKTTKIIKRILIHIIKMYYHYFNKVFFMEIVTEEKPVEIPP
jgi:hypothetical protein